LVSPGKKSNDKKQGHRLGRIAEIGNFLAVDKTDTRIDSYVDNEIQTIINLKSKARESQITLIPY
jgi:hypothetical protein